MFVPPTLLLLLLSTSLPATLAQHIPRPQPRAIPSIIPSLQKIDSDTKSLSSGIAVYTDGIGSLPPQNRYSTLTSDLQAAATNAASPASPPYSKSQAAAICDYVNGTLRPDMEGLVDALVRKRNTFVSSGLKQTVMDDLQVLRNDTGKLIGTLVKMSPGGKQGTCSGAGGEIAGAYASAIAVYQGS